MSPVNVKQARLMLERFGFDASRSNERSAVILLTLLGLSPDGQWKNATGDRMGIRPIMHTATAAWGTTWSDRETPRRQTLHQFVDAAFVEYNSDDPMRPVNSPKANYRVNPAALRVIRAWDTPAASQMLADYLAAQPGQVATYAAARNMQRIPVTLPDGAAVTLSPGGQSILLAAMLSDFAPRFTPGASVLYIGDTDGQSPVYDEPALAALGVVLDKHGKLPDLIMYDAARDWLVLAEAASSHGPVDAKRHAELAELFVEATPGLVYVSCFPSRAVMRKYLAELAWETDVWCADAPDHMVHFNGSRFLGPYQ